MDVQLVVVEGVRRGTVVPVKVDRFVIGRGPDCHLRPRSSAISQYHCVILRRGDHVVVQDFGSTNGTLVNDYPIYKGEELRIHHGDRLQVGHLIFEVKIADELKAHDDELPIAEWLMAPGEVSNDDPNTQTLILEGLRSKAAQPELNASAPASSADEPTARFLYRKHNPERGIICLGLTQGQVASDVELRVLRKQLFEWAALPKFRRMILDFSNVEVVTSGLCALLLNLTRRCRNSGGELRLCHLPPEVRRIFHELKIDSLMSCFEDVEEAMSEPWET